jgi:hypothetical protein
VESERGCEARKLGMDVDVHLKVEDWKLGRQKTVPVRSFASQTHFTSV